MASVLVTAAPLIAGLILSDSGNDSTMPTWFLFLVPLQVGAFTYLITRTLQARVDAEAQGEGS